MGHSCSAQAGRQRTPVTTTIPMGYHTNLPCLRQSRRRQTSLALKAPRAFNLSKLGAPSCLRALNRSAQAGRQRTPVTTELPMNYHTNLPCLRQSRRRQTSLALKAPRAFNLSKLGAPSCLRALNRSAQAGRRARSADSSES